MVTRNVADRKPSTAPLVVKLMAPAILSNSLPRQGLEPDCDTEDFISVA